MAQSRSLLDRLDQRGTWSFLAILYVVRWVVLAPVMAATYLLASNTQAADPTANMLANVNVFALLVPLIVVSPLLETLVECTVPYLIISRVRGYRESGLRRRWGFIIISACIMAILHPIVSAIVPSLITGMFLAYCYAHFAERSVGKAILATTGFHGAINVVGWTVIVLSRT